MIPFELPPPPEDVVILDLTCNIKDLDTLGLLTLEFNQQIQQDLLEASKRMEEEAARNL